MRAIRVLLLATAVLVASNTPASAASLTIDFEAFSDGDVLGTATDGDLIVTFTNAIALTGDSGNPYEFPPHSGQVVITNDADSIVIDFSRTVTSFSGYFTYASALTLQGYDGNGAIPTAVASSAFTENYVSSGNAPNELLTITFAGGISRIEIAGSAFGFVLDDLTVVYPDVQNVPEPTTAALLLLGGAAMAFNERRRRSRH